MNIFLKSFLAAAISATTLSIYAQVQTVEVIPRAIPGGTNAANNNPTAGYGSSTVQTQIRVDVKDSEDAIHFVRGNTDPFVVTKLYELKHANPYAIRGYLLNVVKGVQINQRPVQVEAVKFNDGRGVVFAYKLVSKSVTERSNRGDELGDSSTVGGELTLGFKTEKLLASYIKENDVEQTIGIPFLVKIPVLKYLFGTTTNIKERTYVVVTAEASLVHPDGPVATAEPVVESDFGSDR